jgi:hypothetical protein
MSQDNGLAPSDLVDDGQKYGPQKHPVIHTILKLIFNSFHIA